MPKRNTIVISGSFHRYLTGINQTIKTFQSLGVEVLSPRASRAINPRGKFVFLKTDKPRDPKIVEQKHLEAISKAEALYLYNPDGYLGDSAKLELGWALALGKPIFCKSPAEDVIIKLFCGPVATPAEVKKALQKKAVEVALPNRLKNL